MSPSLTTQFNRSLSALPLLAIALAAALGAGTLPAAAPGSGDAIMVHAAHASDLAAMSPVQGAAATLPGDDAVASGPRLDCAAGILPPGARGLARMPGDITTLADRLRCAQ